MRFLQIMRKPFGSLSSPVGAPPTRVDVLVEISHVLLSHPPILGLRDEGGPIEGASQVMRDREGTLALKKIRWRPQGQSVHG
jgi:hypothetical protein